MSIYAVRRNLFIGRVIVIIRRTKKYITIHLLYHRLRRSTSRLHKRGKDPLSVSSFRRRVGLSVKGRKELRLIHVYSSRKYILPSSSVRAKVQFLKVFVETEMVRRQGKVVELRLLLRNLLLP